MTKHKNNYYLAASFCLVAFVILGYTVKFYPNMILPFDHFFQQLLRTPLSPDKTLYFKGLTFFGNSTTIATFLFFTALFLLLRKYYSELLWVVGVTVIGAMTNYLIKFVYQRPRPTIEHLVEASHYSFPSGHAMASLIFYGSLIILIHLHFKNKFLKWGLSLIMTLLTLLIGISRIYVGVHYPTDIIGGFLLGAPILLASLPYFYQKRFIWRFKGKQT